MELFAYKAMDEFGHVVKGRLSAANSDELESGLRHQGLDLISFKQVRPTSLGFTHTAINRRDLIHFCFQLQQLTGAGLPLLQGLSDLRDAQENRRFREIISAIIDAISGGKNFSDALALHPSLFDAIFVNLIRVGEQSGQLPAVLHELTEELKWQDALSARARKALTYPIFVGAVIGAVVAFLMFYLVPQLVTFVAAMHGELPWQTKVLLALSDLLVSFWWLLLGLPLSLAGGIWLAVRRNPQLRVRLDAQKLRLWLIGEIVGKVTLARFSRLFALMYRSGLPVLEIMTLSSQLAGNRAIGEAIVAAHTQIVQGKSIAHALECSALFPPLVLRMIKVGEATGALDQALINVAYFYDRDVKERIDKFEALVEPTMTVILGLLLGWIALAVLAPIYDLIARIGA